MRTYIKASTLSVLLTNSTSVLCYVKIGRESCNLTLRFDRGEDAVLCGYPKQWAVHDFEEDQIPEEELSFDVYVSAQTEKKILSKLLKSLEEQFLDPMFIDHCSNEYREIAIRKIVNTINNL